MLNELSVQLPTFGKMALGAAHYSSAKIFPRSNTARKIYHGVRNWYEGGWPMWTGGEYSYLPSLVQDAKWDQNYVTRREMMRRMRYWSQNSTIVEAILSVGERYTVGASGLHVSFYPSDDVSADAENSWYDRADAVIAEWFQNCGWNGETMEKLLKVGYRCQKVDGEVFFIKSRKQLPLILGDRTLQVQKPVLQMVEAHRVESPWNKWEDEGRNMIDGVQFKVVNVAGRDLLSKTGYWTRNGMGSFEQNDSWFEIPGDSIFHLFNSHRANQYRGLSDFYTCEVVINKHEDTLNIEMKAHSSHAVRAVGVETASGQAASPMDTRLEKINQVMGRPQPQQVGNDLAGRCETYRKETGAYVYGLKFGEKIHFDSPTRPSDSTLNLLEYQVNSICAGAHAPRCLVFEKISGASARGQGTEVRAQLDCADAYYKSDFQKWKAFVRDAVIYYMEWAIKNDQRVADPPANWRECIHIQQPEACNVDVGYNTQAQLMSLAAGATDYDAILGPQGRNFNTEIKKLARQQKLMEKLGVKVTLPALLPGQIPLEGKSVRQEQELQTA